ncbi:MAG: MerR family transcriptional regulator [Gammaproteobacteria bacterium]
MGAYVRRSAAQGSHFKIGAFSELADCTIETIRYYERIGLLPPPPRTQGGYRLYPEEHLKRLNFIRRARDLGFTLDQVRTLLRLANDQVRSCGEVREIAAAHLDEVRTRIADLKMMERVLKAMTARCEDGDLPNCPLIEALFRDAAEKSSEKKR